MKYLIILCLVISSALAQMPLGTEFTYQGELKDASGNPLSGQYDFKFIAFDTLADGTGMNLGTVIVENTQVNNGVFTTLVDFGDGVFIGDSVWMEISVRIGTSVGGFQQLLPRQQVTAAPYAIHAQFVGADAISAIEIQDGSITAADLAPNSVTASKISDNAVGLSKIITSEVQRRVSGSCLVGDFITGINEDGTLNCLADSVGLTFVKSTDIIDGTIQSIDVALGGIKMANMADDAIDSNIILDESITASDLAANSVGRSEIIAKAVGSTEIDTTEVQNRVIGQCLYPEYVTSVAQNGDLTCARMPIGVVSVIEPYANFARHSSIAIGVDEYPIISFAGESSRLTIVKCNNQSCSTSNPPIILDHVAGAGEYSSIAIGADNNPIISYTATIEKELKVVKCTNQSCSSFNPPLVLDSSIGIDVGYFTSLAIGADDNPIISYFDATNGDLKVIKCSNQSCSAFTPPVILDSVGIVGYYTSIAIGADNNPIISYYDFTNEDLKVVKCSNPNCTNFNPPVILDSIGAVGEYTSIAIGADSIPIISYYDKTNGNLKSVKCSDQNCSNFTFSNVLHSEGDVGKYTSIVIGADNNPVIGYYDETNGNLNILRCSSQNCSASKRFITILDSVGDVGEFLSVAIGADNSPIVSYFDVTNGFLKVYSCGDEACSR